MADVNNPEASKVIKAIHDQAKREGKTFSDILNERATYIPDPISVTTELKKEEN